MFAAKDLPTGTVIAEEESLARLLSFDVHTTCDDPCYSDIVDDLNTQFVQLAENGHGEFLESLKPFDDPLLFEADHTLKVMRKYGLKFFIHSSSIVPLCSGISVESTTLVTLRMPRLAPSVPSQTTAHMVGWKRRGISQSERRF